MTDLPPNVYRLPQSRFDAIYGSPWVSIGCPMAFAGSWINQRG